MSFETGCEGKIKHEFRYQAQGHAKTLTQEMGIKYQDYLCKHCNYFHVGHAKEKETWSPDSYSFSQKIFAVARKPKAKKKVRSAKDKAFCEQQSAKVKELEVKWKAQPSGLSLEEEAKAKRLKLSWTSYKALYHPEAILNREQQKRKEWYQKSHQDWLKELEADVYRWENDGGYCKTID